MLASQKDRLAASITRALQQALGAPLPAGIAVTLERPKVEAHGDLACNVALQAARPLKRNPRDVAQALVAALLADPEAADLVAAAEVAGPGFVNLRLAPVVRHAVVRTVLAEGAAYGRSTAGHDDQGRPRPVMVEFVSANPTGPLHMGHARQGALGDALAALLEATGWAVTREFYYNDAGVQIDKLATSVQARARELAGQAVTFPEDGYHGEYVVDIARDFLARGVVGSRDGAPSTASGDPDDLDGIRRFAVAFLRHEQDLDLDAFGIRFDNFYLESSLYGEGRVAATVQALVASGFTYEKDGALWLRTTAIDALGDWPKDDQDRVMRKSDGTYTYFVPDVAYHVTKWQRGFHRDINVQGSDHHGTVARVRAGLQAAGRGLGVAIPAGYPDYLLHKMVRVMKGGEEVKMSKRAGTVVALRDVVEWVGRDAARYFLVSRKGDAEFTFDVDLALQKSDENPVYYVQYAHARICSVLQTAAERDVGLDEAAARALPLAALAPLDGRAAFALIAQLARWPEVVRDAAQELAPHHVPNYLKDLSADFHAFYNADRVLVDEPAPRQARLALLLATRQVLRNGLALIGVTAPERM